MDNIMSKNKKVYCQNCSNEKIFKGEGYREPYCLNNGKILQIGVFSGYWCKQKNKNNNCKSYYRKWWKFWVKD